MSNSFVYSTEDFQLATVLMYFQYTLEEISLHQVSLRASFYFAKDQKIDETVEAFWKGALTVEPLKLFQCYKLLKNRLNEAKRKYETK